VSSSNTSGASPGRGPLVIVLAIIGVLGIIGGILYVSGAANSIHFIDGSVYHGHHQVRAVVSFIVGIAFLIMAYIAKTRPVQTRSPQPTQANVAGSASATGPASAAGPAGPASAAGPAGPASAADPASGTGTTSGSGTPTTPSGS
jgi:predicted lipid-binding transport protein (Tim44 family)